MITLDKVVDQVEEFLTATEQARLNSIICREYYNHIQWTESEAATLRSRGQAPVVVNRVKPKVEGMKGLLISRRTDPKALPRTQKHEKAAEAVTDALRYINDNVDLDQVELDVADSIFVGGYGAAIIETKQVGNETEVDVTEIPWDRYYYDIHSRRKDFADKRWDGIMLWMSFDEAKETFDLTDEDFDELLADQHSVDEFEDRPRWIDKKEQRIRIAQHFILDKGVWHVCYFTEQRFLVDPIPSPYLDEFGEPVNPIEAQSANVDCDNNRMGEVWYWLDLQRELNHRRSKYLFLLSQRQTKSRRGAIKDVPAMKRELAKPDGHVEYDGETGDFDVIRTNDMSDAQFTLYNDAKQELDAVGFNAQLSGERQGDLSGRAISNLQQAATNELSSLYTGIGGWKKRIYRQCWQRVRQFWTEEKWVRILDDQSVIRWVGFNQPITVEELMNEQMSDESLDLFTRKRVAAQFQQMFQAQDPRLQEITEIRNEVAEIDVDINIELALDTPNIKQEQFEILANIAQTRPEVPFTSLLRLSGVRSKEKDAITEEIQAQQQSIGEAQQQEAAVKTAAEQAKANEKDAKTRNLDSDTQKKDQEAVQTMIQNNLLLEQPPEDSAVII